MWSVAWAQFINAEEAVGGAQRENTRNHTSKAVFLLRCLPATLCAEQACNLSVSSNNDTDQYCCPYNYNEHSVNCIITIYICLLVKTKMESSGTK